MDNQNEVTDFTQPSEPSVQNVSPASPQQTNDSGLRIDPMSEPEGFSLSKIVKTKNFKIYAGLGVVVLVFLGVILWLNFGQGDVEVDPFLSGGNGQKSSTRDSNKTEVKSYDKADIPPGIPGNLPREGEVEVINNFVYEAPDGNKKYVREFIVKNNPFNAINIYSDFFIKEGWMFDPSLVVNKDNLKIAGAYKDRDFLKIVVSSVPDKPNQARVDISIIKNK